ncbi:MAG: DNA repair protein RadC [Myxococcales bacterium]|nr:DNA repair protein RadC [Myxococcales bacterium]
MQLVRPALGGAAMNPNALSRAPLDDPHARVRRVGVDLLSDAEVLALAIGPAHREPSPYAAAVALLDEHGGLAGLMRGSIGSLAPSLGARRAARLLAALELCRRAREQPLQYLRRCLSSREVVAAFGPRLRAATEECVVVVVLDARQRVLAERVVARGPISAVAVGMREVFSLVVREGGAGVVVLHNHPSGDPRPSEADLRFTRGLHDACLCLDMLLLDHIVVAREGYFSFRDSGLLGRDGVNDDGEKSR